MQKIVYPPHKSKNYYVDIYTAVSHFDGKVVITHERIFIYNDTITSKHSITKVIFEFNYEVAAKAFVNDMKCGNRSIEQIMNINSG